MIMKDNDRRKIDNLIRYVANRKYRIEEVDKIDIV